MKTLIFIDNDLPEKANENLGHAYRSLKYNGGMKIQSSDITLISEFHKAKSKLEDKMFDISNVIITWSMFTENHFDSYGQLCDFMVIAGMQELKDKVYIDTAKYLADTLERAIEHYNQSVYIIRCIENNYIIHYNEDDGKFYRLRFDINSNSFLKNEIVNISELIA